MTTAVPYPNDSHAPISDQPHQMPFRDWHDGLCQCNNDWKTCYCVTLCTFCYMCYMYKRYNENVCTPLFIPTPIMALRTYHRGRERISGSIFCDCVSSLFCPWCALCQLDRDMKYEEATRGYLDV
ncbi:putative placenta-specificprotein 8 protein (C15 protein) (Onzin) [Fasciolopsis buskii]|uniref:Putative placenta-specificprotein 8 protein (C15 protein) (Onzin) n=1 Tax=Fasciolopsis buskii TaxID=27845 RepID=A0A8E0VLK7_9TREM|nr:putative placenta-specificprotein 8 protein (C15 protein) (Onzin) [Fasciolopsis buski]